MKWNKQTRHAVDALNRTKLHQKPVLIIELTEYSPWEYLTTDSFEINKRNYITRT